MSTNGWTYYTDITPLKLPDEQNLQNIYLYNYNNAFERFINSLLINKSTLTNHFENIDSKTSKLNNKYIININCFGENDIIINNNYPISFLKSKFINLRKPLIKSKLINYYKPLGLYVKGPFKLLNDTNTNDNYYYIELLNYSK